MNGGSSHVAPMPVSWLRFLRLYVGYSVVAHLAWEIVQLPLYTIWATAAVRELVLAVLHCTAGDLIIASVAFLLALLARGNSTWPAHGLIGVAATAIAIGIGYTAYSEWLNVYVHQSWAYSEWMPIIPATGIGLAPMLQWLIVPTA